MATIAAREAPPVTWTRAAFGLLAFVIVAQSVPVFLEAMGQGHYNGNDYRLYMHAATDWLRGAAFYPAHQLAGPYDIVDGDILYPPVALALLVPFTILPAVLWWGIPVAITAWVVWHHRPGPIAWPLIALCIAWPPSQIHLLSGNPGLWAMAFCALATVWPVFGPFVLVKPSLFPFGAVGIRHRSWWVGLVAFALLSAAFLPMWSDWLTVMGNQHNAGGFLYSWQYAPMMLIPVIASLGAGRGARDSAPSRRSPSARVSAWRSRHTSAAPQGQA